MTVLITALLDLFRTKRRRARIRKAAVMAITAGTISNLARFSNPKGVAVDGAGNLYIAHTSNHLIRRVDPAGTITTFAGNGQRQWDMR